MDSPGVLGRRRGRPPLVVGETTTAITIRVSTRDLARAYALARRDRVGVPALFRRGLARVLEDECAPFPVNAD